MNMNDVLYDYPPDDDGLPFDEHAGYSVCPVCHHLSLFNDECENCTFGGESVSPQSEGEAKGNPTTHAADGAETCPYDGLNHTYAPATGRCVFCDQPRS